MKLMLIVSTVVLVVAILIVNRGWAQSRTQPKAHVSFDDYKSLVAEVETQRKDRLIDLDTFLRMSKESNVIILDSRSKDRFDRIHVKGATHLAFTDFTQDNLKSVIPNAETKLLIYCNNNFEGNQIDFATKLYRMPAAGLDAQSTPVLMALNIPTYINLYGYGYHNVYELDELVNVNDRRIEFEGSTVVRKLTPTAVR